MITTKFNKPLFSIGLDWAMVKPSWLVGVDLEDRAISIKSLTKLTVKVGL